MCTHCSCLVLMCQQGRHGKANILSARNPRERGTGTVDARRQGGERGGEGGGRSVGPGVGAGGKRGGAEGPVLAKRKEELAPWSFPLHWAAALGEHRVCQKVDSLHLYQAASMPQPDCLHGVLCIRRLRLLCLLTSISTWLTVRFAPCRSGRKLRMHEKPLC